MNKNSGDRRVAVECEVALHHPVATLVATRDAQEMWTLAWVNRGAAAFFGLPAGQMTGGDLLTRVGLHAVLEHAHAKAASRYRTTLLLSGTHESSWMDVTCAAMEGGGPARYLVTFTPTLIEAAHHSPTREAQLHAGLQLAVQTSELLTLGDSQNVVRLIAELVARTCGHRTGFFTLRHHDGLQEISGMISDREDIAEVDHERAARDPLTHWWQTTGGARTFRVPAPVPSTGAFARLITQLQARPGDRITVIAARTHTSMPLLLAATPAGEGSWSHAAMGELLEPTCRRVATALETFEYRSRNQVLIEALQRSMLPAHGEVGDLDVWSYYLPHSRVAHVGGDWFDIRAADRDTTQVILGDAVGHDVESIATMNQIRAVLASLSGTRMRPNRLISRADTAVQGLRIANTAALSVTEFSRTRLGQWQIHYALAGHLPGVRITRGGALPLISSASGLLGYPTATRVTHRVTLHPGDAIVLFTDGLIERRGIDLQTAMANLCRFLGTIATLDAASIGE
ncbi:MAG: PP2C family protein-serine/threonine phosphatase, partial [Bowdeniella nasicola]|nr:PP2C family protein-serine/threonine phosphatase [Bowdeniella nasicola]